MKRDAINVKIPIARFFTNKKVFTTFYPKNYVLQPIFKLQVMVLGALRKILEKFKKSKFRKSSVKKN